MTTTYIEIIRKSPYYPQVDGRSLEASIPSTSTITKENDGDFWEEWKDNLPDCYEKEKVFLDIVRVSSSLQTLSWMEVVQKNPMTVKDIFEKEHVHLVIPRREYWELIRQNMRKNETLPIYFLRVALEYYHDDWTATVQCFRNLLTGRILLGHQEKKCFIKGTPVWTLNGIQRIEEVRVDDWVATHNGRFSRVEATFQNPLKNRPLCHVYGALGWIATTTTDHRFLTYSKEHNRIVWKEAGQLHPNDFLLKAFLHPTPAIHLPFPHSIPISQILNKFPRVAGASMSMFCGNQGNTENIDTSECQHYIEENNYKLYEDLIMLLYDVEMRLHIWKWVLKSQQHLFVQGWVDAFEGKTWFELEREAQMVGMVLNLFRYDVYVEHVINHRRCMRGWVVCKRKMCDDGDTFKTRGMEFVRFVKRKPTRNFLFDQHKYVYTLQVEDDHSYNVNGFIVKNCTGLTADTYVLKRDGLVPVATLCRGEYLFDENYKETRIHNITKTRYTGKIVSIDNHGHTFSTPLHKDKIIRPNLSIYYDPDMDKHVSLHHVQFLLGYLTKWDIQESKGWSSWEATSLSDRIMLTHILQKNIYSFQYHMSDMFISIQTNALHAFVSKCISYLLFISTERLLYFFSCLERTRPRMWRLDLTEQGFVHALHSLVRAKTRPTLKDYVGDIYQIEVENGSGFCAVHAMIRCDRKIPLTEWMRGCGASHVRVPDSFFQKDFPNDLWEEMITSQLTHGTPSLILTDRNKNECVSGDTRILTRQGILPIATKKDEMVSVWNGADFEDVMVMQTGQEKKFLKLSFSNGMCLTCTPYHKLFLVSRHDKNQIIKVDASHLKCGDELAPYRLPPLSLDVPSSVLMTLEWIAKRSIHIEDSIVLFDRDVESLRDILLDLQCCGIQSHITFNSFRNEHELKMKRARWNQLNYRNMDKEPANREGDVVEGISVVRIDESSKYEHSYCFQEKVAGMAIFEGVATGQCENMMSVHCVEGHLDLCRFLVRNPFKKQLHNMVVYTSSQCPFLPLLQSCYDGTLEVRDIDVFREEWEQKRHIHALSNVPAIFIENFYVGDFMDVWGKYLCPLLDWDALKHTVRSLCRGLDASLEQATSSRSILLNISGFHDVLAAMKLTLDDPKTRQLNSSVFETIFHTALGTSIELSVEKGCCDDSDKIVPMLSKTIQNETLCRDMRTFGVRNMIYLKTWETKKLRTWWEQDMKAIPQNTIIPNYLKQVHQQDVTSSVLLEMMIDRKAHHVMDNTFTISIHKEMDRETLKKLIQRAWSGGFHKIEINNHSQK